MGPGGSERGSYKRSAQGDEARHAQALRLLGKHDADASGSIDEAEFRVMTALVLGTTPEDTQETPHADEGRRRAAGASEHLGRTFKKRQRSRLFMLMTRYSCTVKSPPSRLSLNLPYSVREWVLVPGAMGILIMVLGYRSTVRRASKPSRWASAGYTVSNRANKNR